MFQPGLAAAAVATSAMAGGGCDCGWSLCGSCYCWWPLRLTAYDECGHCCGWCSLRGAAAFVCLGVAAPSAEQLRLQWLLLLATVADAATIGSYGYFVAAVAGVFC